jgi:hypothetical protein
LFRFLVDKFQSISIPTRFLTIVPEDQRQLASKTEGKYRRTISIQTLTMSKAPTSKSFPGNNLPISVIEDITAVRKAYPEKLQPSESAAADPISNEELSQSEPASPDLNAPTQPEDGESSDEDDDDDDQGSQISWEQSPLGHLKEKGPQLPPDSSPAVVAVPDFGNGVTNGQAVASPLKNMTNVAIRSSIPRSLGASPNGNSAPSPMLHSLAAGQPVATAMPMSTEEDIDMAEAIPQPLIPNKTRRRPLAFISVSPPDGKDHRELEIRVQETPKSERGRSTASSSRATRPLSPATPEKVNDQLYDEMVRSAQKPSPQLAPALPSPKKRAYAETRTGSPPSGTSPSAKRRAAQKNVPTNMEFNPLRAVKIAYDFTQEAEVSQDPSSAVGRKREEFFSHSTMQPPMESRKSGKTRAAVSSPAPNRKPFSVLQSSLRRATLNPSNQYPRNDTRYSSMESTDERLIRSSATSSVPHIFSEFCSQYSDYGGDESHFEGICRMLLRLRETGRMPHKWLWDDFIIRHYNDYIEYANRCVALGEDPSPYKPFYDEMIEEPLYTGGVMTLEKLQAAVETNVAIKYGTRVSS